MSCDRRDGQIRILENLLRGRVCGGRGNVMCMQRDGRGEILQISEGALGAEQYFQKFTGAGEVSILATSRRTPGAPDVEHDGPGTRYSPGFEQTEYFAGVIDVQVSEQHDVGIRQRGLRLAKASEGSGTCVDENTRIAVDEDQVARCRAPRSARAAGAENQQFQRRGGIFRP